MLPLSKHCWQAKTPDCLDNTVYRSHWEGGGLYKGYMQNAEKIEGKKTSGLYTP